MDAKYCSACGSALETFDDNGHARPRCKSCGRVHYVNPKSAVAALIVRDGRILLSLRARPPHEGEWDLPGGFIESGEHPEDAIVREIREETGLAARVQRLVHVGTGTYGSADTLNLVYHVSVPDCAEPGAHDDSLEMRWWPLDAIPPLAFPHEADAVRAFRASEGL